MKQELINSELWGHDQINFQNEGEKDGDAYDPPGSQQSVRHGGSREVEYMEWKKGKRFWGKM